MKKEAEESKNLNLAAIRKKLIGWYSLHKRDLPWRWTQDPYHIWLSEVILQQTRVAQGLSYYNSFIRQYPSVCHLAAAPENEVMKLWQGLGYYSRARNLHTTAKVICDRYNGVFPSDYKTILSLKGIGQYTAAAIASFAYGMPVATVDGNVYRVLSRLFAIDTPIDSTEGKKLFALLADKLLNKENPGEHNQALMEFGALQCTPTSPQCIDCPLEGLCLSRAGNDVLCYPVKQGKAVVKPRFFNYFDVRCNGNIFLHKRAGNDIWRNLYEFPLIETPSYMPLNELMQTNPFEIMFADAGAGAFRKEFSVKHVLSHQIIHANFYSVNIENDKYFTENYLSTPIENIDQYPVPRLIHKYLEKKEEIK
ncbi:A/G-specific adenine glycosylase [Dysgonomonas sp. PH5-45]|uniref:A/G-specific adenine glycosylase n=1 Tax=unclassified Dysgonomonas TaxID=2630389 RepID=UPI002475F0D0|nr:MULTISPECIES: A/G-specific adenine glycosylase [unclassified Dysgonomonas]MDH6356068.1 A/G-specific adenine glycosylase [Dysgonomonas sp. PH5-45]MDH6388957.1 A/G-specific adenine glycosylase [Dysgonomonas sp. PH5-37]